MKKNKGEYGYIHSQKIKRTLITIVMFAIPITIFITGLIITKTRLNMFTFVAIMGCLPASRSATGLAMMLMMIWRPQGLMPPRSRRYGVAALLEAIKARACAAAECNAVRLADDARTAEKEGGRA